MHGSSSRLSMHPAAISFGRSTDGFGTLLWRFGLPDPPLKPGWCIVDRQRTEDGEHIWIIETSAGERFRWLEDEGGPEWSYRRRLGFQQTS